MATKKLYSSFVNLSTFMERSRHCYRALSISGVFISIAFLFASCGKEPVSFTAEQRKAADSIVRSTHGIDSLALLQKRLESENDKLGSIIA